MRAALTRLRPPAGTAVTCSAPAVVTRRSQCQASSCLSPAECVRAATVACSSDKPRWTWSWTNPSQPAPTELWSNGTGALLKKSTRASQNVPTNSTRVFAAGFCVRAEVDVKQELNGVLGCSPRPEEREWTSCWSDPGRWRRLSL